jgi:hypothetical protein
VRRRAEVGGPPARWGAQGHDDARDTPAALRPGRTVGMRTIEPGAQIALATPSAERR